MQVVRIRWTVSIALCAFPLGLLACGSDSPVADVECPAGLVDCDGSDSNGCEVDVNEQCAGVVGATGVTWACATSTPRT